MADQPLKANEAGLFYYDANVSRWRRLIVATGSAGAAGPAGGDLSGTYPNPVVTQASTSFALPGDISPPQITADQNDYNPTGLSAAAVLKLNTDAARALTGLSGGADGRLLVLLNNGANDLVIKDQGAASAAANRFSLSTPPTPSAAVWSPGFVLNLNLQFASTTSVLVTAGLCVDALNLTNMTLAVDSLISTASGSFGVLGGVDTSATLAGTITASGGTIVGTGTSFLTAWNSRTLTGTISSSGTAVTGVGTKFLSQVRVYDLVGGIQVTAIVDDTHLTLVGAPAAPFSGATVSVIDQPLLLASGQSPVRVTTILSNTQLTAPGTYTSQTYKVGGWFPGDGTHNSYMYAWLVSNGTTTGVILSSQINKPHMAASYPTVRRIGTITCDSSGNVMQFAQWGNQNEREYEYFLNLTANSSRILAAGTSGSWVFAAASVIIPPTAAVLIASCQCLANTGISIRPANYGASNTSTSTKIVYGNASNVESPLSCKCDGAQNIQWIGNSAYIDVCGYKEYL